MNQIRITVLIILMILHMSMVEMKEIIDDLEASNLEMFKAEKKVYMLSGLPEGYIKFKNVRVGTYKDKPIYIRTVISGDPKNPKLVLLPGFQTSTALFY